MNSNKFRPKRRKPVRLSRRRRRRFAQPKQDPPSTDSPNTIPTINNNNHEKQNEKQPTITPPPSFPDEGQNQSENTPVATNNNNKPSPPSKAAPDPKSNVVVPLRWRPNTPSNNYINSRLQRGKRQSMNRRSRMSETARRMLGLMSVMMAGRAQGVTTGVFSKQNNDVQTGLDGNIC